MPRQVHVSLPQLLPAGIGRSGMTLPRLPAIESLLTRAEPRRSPLNDPEDYICAEMGIGDGDAPLGALCRYADTEENDGRWRFRAAPVHLMPDRDRLRLSPEAPALEREEADALAGELNAHFGEEGLLFEVATPSRWYVAVESAPELQTTSPEGLGGADIRPYLPKGPDALPWHARLNEVQMLLHNSAVNAERESGGKLPVTGLWLWGGGVLPQQLPPEVDWAIWADSGVCAARGLSRLSGRSPQGVPVSADAVLSSPVERAFVVTTEFRDAIIDRDITRWLETAKHWEANWFAPLLRALRLGKLERLALHCGPAIFVLTPLQAWRVWRRRRPMAAVERLLEEANGPE